MSTYSDDSGHIHIESILDDPQDIASWVLGNLMAGATLAYDGRSTWWLQGVTPNPIEVPGKIVEIVKNIVDLRDGGPGASGWTYYVL